MLESSARPILTVGKKGKTCLLTDGWEMIPFKFTPINLIRGVWVTYKQKGRRTTKASLCYWDSSNSRHMPDPQGRWVKVAMPS